MSEYDLGATHFESERLKDLGTALDNARHGRLSKDWRSSITAIERSVTESGGLVWSTPKIHERRSVPFPAVLADELSALMVGKGRDDLVFTDMRGGVLRNSNWRARVFQPAIEKCHKADDTFPLITPHDLRHTAASLAVSAGRMSKPCNGC